jgi:hypothetical protein
LNLSHQIKGDYTCEENNLEQKSDFFETAFYCEKFGVTTIFFILSRISAEEMSMSGDTKVIKLRGLPWNVSCKEIMDFLKDINVENGEKGTCHLIRHQLPYLFLRSINQFTFCFCANWSVLYDIILFV